jgi:hypothetical protein
MVRSGRFTRETIATAATAVQVRTAMEALDLHQVATHFTGGVDENDDVEPLLVCDGVSVNAFNGFVGGGEGLPIGVRFLQLEPDGHLLIIECPT